MLDALMNLTQYRPEDYQRLCQVACACRPLRR